MNKELVEWQRYSPTNGMIQCWFTHPCLDWIEHQDWEDKIIIMFGAGLGDAWLAERCKKLFVVERNQEWLEAAKDVCRMSGIDNIEYIYRPCNDSDGKADYYLNINGLHPDIIINDDAYRTECCQMAVDYFKGKGGILVSDNWYQSFVWLSDKAVEIMNPYTSLIFEQTDHTDNDGINKWKTAVHFIK